MAKLVCAAVLISAALVFHSAEAQHCDAKQTESTPARRFTLSNTAGTAIDSQGGLEWRRCSEGQHWQGHGCHGTPLELSVEDAQKYVQQLNAAQHSPWRLPTHDELMALVEARCSGPAINLQVFPATPAAVFWTASDVGVTSYWSVDFNTGYDNMADHSQTHLLRLVRKP